MRSDLDRGASNRFQATMAHKYIAITIPKKRLIVGMRLMLPHTPVAQIQRAQWTAGPRERGSAGTTLPPRRRRTVAWLLHFIAAEASLATASLLV
jgi:hypothetical protein